MPHFSDIGEALRWLRKERGLKQAEVAAAAGITSPMLSAYETGKQRPSFATIDKILAALESGAEDLSTALVSIGGAAEEDPPPTCGEPPSPQVGLEMIVSLESEIHRLIAEQEEEATPEERFVLTRLVMALLWMLRHLEHRQDEPTAG